MQHGGHQNPHGMVSRFHLCPGGEQRYRMRMFVEELRCVSLWAETHRLSWEPVWLGRGVFSVGVVLDMTESQYLGKGWIAISEFCGVFQDPNFSEMMRKRM